MKLLAIDTSAAAASVALLNHDDIKVKHEIIPMQQAQQILTMIAKLLADNNMQLNELSAMAFGCGPGSFTGVRIATSVIQGLAYATQLPVISVSSLAAAAQSAYQELHWEKIIVAMDARMGEVYTGAYQLNTQGLMELQGREMVCPPEIIPQPTTSNWYGIGNGWSAYADKLRFKPTEVAADYLPSALGVVLLAKDKFLRKEWLPAQAALPVYLRDEVAEKGR